MRITHPPAPRHFHGRQAGKLDLKCAPPLLTQMLSLRALAGKAFTTLRAGFAFTMTTLPKTSRLPAFVAGFVLVFSLQRPGSMKMPVLATSVAANSAKLLMALAQTDFFNSHDVA